jgi:hypothetical protein
VEWKDEMAKLERINRADEPKSQIEIEGEPHPVDLLASLTRADNAGMARSTLNATLPISEAGGPELPQIPVETQRGDVAAAARALAAHPANPPEDEASAMQRTMRALGSALPLLQRLMPLMDGNAQSPMTQYAPGPAAQKTADLTPIQGGLSELKAQQRDLRTQIAEQDASMKRMADQLEMVRTAQDRNTLEQQELIDELKVAGRKMNVVAFFAFTMLAASIAVNVYLYLQIHRLIP